MLTLLYKFVLRFKKQDEVSRDMLATFEEARAEAWANGLRTYCGFALREVLGLLGAQGLRGRPWRVIIGWSLAGLAVGIGATYLVPAQYTSSATLRVTPPVISETLSNGGVRLNADKALATLLPVLESRTVMTTIINTFDLYPNARKRFPIQDVLDRMRKDLHIQSGGANLITVSFSYGDSANSCASYDWQEPDTHCDRNQAQRAVQDLVSRLIDENIRRRSNDAFLTQRYFGGRTDEIAKEWEKLNTALRGVQPSSPQYERMLLDRDLARKEYESVHQRLRDSKMAQAMEGSKLGAVLEMLDPASLPQSPDTSPFMIALAGLVAGLVLGSFLALIRTLRRTPELLLPVAIQG